MRGNVFCLAFVASLAIEVVAQRTTISVGADDDDDSLSSVPTSTSTSEDPGTCGYVDGDPDDAVTCPSSCALLFVSGRDSLYYGCCNDEQCNIPITCIESGTASGRATLACTEGPSSRCKTWTWPDLTAEAYACDTTRTKLTVATEATSITTTSGIISTRTDITVSAAPTEGDGGDNDDDSGSPGIGWEHDLDSRQRVGAGIGSGVTGGLLLIFFGIFGCWRGPARRETQPRTQRQETEQSEVQSPGGKAAVKRKVTDRVTMEETQPSASWTSSPIDIQSPQPFRPQPPYYSTSDIPGSSMGYRNPQYQ